MHMPYPIVYRTQDSRHDSRLGSAVQCRQAVGCGLCCISLSAGCCRVCAVHDALESGLSSVARLVRYGYAPRACCCCTFSTKSCCHEGRRAAAGVTSGAPGHVSSAPDIRGKGGLLACHEMSISGAPGHTSSAPIQRWSACVGSHQGVLRESSGSPQGVLAKSSGSPRGAQRTDR